jgi:hypothetical protein
LKASLSLSSLVERNGSVSERLWRLVVHRGATDDVADDTPLPEVVDANWLGDMPMPIWAIVRDTVLRCI